MPVYSRDGGSWVECIPFARDAGAWTDEDAQLYSRDSDEWKLIYPDPADVSLLLPVEDLAVTEGPTSSTVTIGWTNPTQPDVTPTHVQVRLAELGAVWTEFDYPITESSWGALDEQTEYFAQVRLVRRVDGIITVTSAIKSVGFTTTEAPIGAPAPDPGGSAGDTLIPSGGSTDSPGAPSTAFGCWWEWKVQQLAENAYTWSDTALSGEADGDATEFEIDFASLDAGVIVRVCRREACDTTGDSSADTFGDWECGIPFPAPVDWDAACAGISDSPGVSGLAAEADAVFRYPQLCKVTDTPFDRLIMRDAITGTEIARGGGFAAFFTDVDGEQGVLAGSSETTAQVVMVGGLTATSDMLAPAGDWTIISRFRANSAFSGSNGRVSSIGSWGGLRVVIQLTESATGWTPSALVTTDDGVKTLNGSEITFDEAFTHAIAVRWDDDGNLELFQDAVSQDTVAVSAISMAATPTIASYHAAPGGLGLMQQLGWDRALSDAEIEQFTLLPSTSNILASGAIERSSSTSDYTIPSITPVANTLTFLQIVINNVSGGASAPTSVTGGGLTWVLVDSTNTRTVGVSRGHMAVYRAASASPGSGTIAVTPAQTSDIMAYLCFYLDNTVTSSNGGDAIVQTAKANDTTGTAEVTLAAFASSQNLTVAFVGDHQGGTSKTPVAPLILIDDTADGNGNDTSLNCRATAAWCEEADTTPQVTLNGLSNWGMIGVEVDKS